MRPARARSSTGANRRMYASNSSRSAATSHAETRIPAAGNIAGNFADEDGRLRHSQILDHTDGLDDPVARTHPHAVVQRRVPGETQSRPQDVTEAALVLGIENATHRHRPSHVALGVPNEKIWRPPSCRNSTTTSVNPYDVFRPDRARRRKPRRARRLAATRALAVVMPN